MISSYIDVVDSDTGTQLDGSNGFVVVGTFEKYTTFTGFGSRVSSINDFNGDGINDILIGSQNSYAYLLYGRNTPFHSGIRVNSSYDGDGIGSIFYFDNYGEMVISGLKDINGDGFDEAVFSFEYVYKRYTYVFFGSEKPKRIYHGNELNGTNGFIITNSNGRNMVSADFNCDGYGDFITGTNDPWRPETNISIVYGRKKPFPAFLDVRNLDGKNGTIIYSTKSRITDSVDSGDFDNDGCDDLLINAGTGPYIEGTVLIESNILFNTVRSKINSNTFDLANLDGRNGFNFNKLNTGYPLYSLSKFVGDINGDEIEDIFLSYYAGGCSNKSGVFLFGFTSDYYPNIHINNNTEINGFRVTGEMLTKSASSGDFNGDGLGDVVISTDFSCIPYTGQYPFPGAIYVLFGKKNFKNSYNLDNLNPNDGFIITLTQTRTASNFGISIQGKFDINNDTIDDFIVGANNDYNMIGSAYVFFGGKTFISPSPSPSNTPTPSNSPTPSISFSPAESKSPSPVPSDSASPIPSESPTPSTNVILHSQSCSPTASNDVLPKSDKDEDLKIAGSVFGGVVGLGLISAISYYIYYRYVSYIKTQDIFSNNYSTSNNEVSGNLVNDDYEEL